MAAAEGRMPAPGNTGLSAARQPGTRNVQLGPRPPSCPLIIGSGGRSLAGFVAQAAGDPLPGPATTLGRAELTWAKESRWESCHQAFMAGHAAGA